jgi:glutaredoxin
MYVAPKRCPRCRYERRPGDTAPDWQCPACGVAYVKAEADVPAVRGRYPAPPAGNRGGRRGIWLLGIVLLGALAGLYGRQEPAGSGRSSGAPGAAQPEVVMYATSWCGYCKKARSFFESGGIEYLELDVERDAEAAQINRRLGGGGVPTIMVGDTLVHGYDERELSELLGPWLK